MGSGARRSLVIAALAIVAALSPAVAVAVDGPSVTEQAANVDTTSVGLIGRVDLNGDWAAYESGTYSFRFWAGNGPAPDDAQTIAAAPPPQVTPPPPPQPPGGPVESPPLDVPPGWLVFGAASGLTPGATYSAQLIAVTSDGTATGNPFTFTTLTSEPPPPGGAAIPGPGSQPPAPPPQCALPSLVGHTLAGAQHMLQTGCCHKLGLRVHLVVAHTPRRHARRVTGQTPRARASVAAGQLVTLRLR